MYLADYHVHSLCSPDASFPMEAMAQAAADAGLQELCFTDHMEAAPDEEIRSGSSWEEMLACFTRARERCAHLPVALKIGIEIGGAPLNFPAADRLMDASAEADFVIGSIHALSPAYDCQSLYYLRCEGKEDARAAIADYLDQMIALAQWGRFDVIGHLTLPLRYLNEKYHMAMTFDGFEPQVEAIFRTLIEKGRGIELNTNRGNEPLPGEKWLRMYRQLGGEIITIGSDAHTPDYVGCAVQRSQELLRQCGFTRFCTFSKREAVWHRL